MKRLPLLAITFVAVVASTIGCSRTAGYTVEPLHHETVREELDAQWFQRDIRDHRGKLQAVELMYCPMRKGQPTVCRTAVVWRRNTSDLLRVQDLD